MIGPEERTMTTTMRGVVGRFDSAISTAEQLLWGLKEPVPDYTTLQSGFKDVLVRLRDLPPDSAEDCFLRNTTSDAAALFASLERRAARWQLQQVIRRLQKRREDWAESGKVKNSGVDVR
jgi:hypothetical protein